MKPSTTLNLDPLEKTPVRPAIEAESASLKAAESVTEAKKALEDAAAFDAKAASAERLAKAEVAREKAARFMADHKYSEAKKALDDAEKLETDAVDLHKPALAKEVRDKAAKYMAEKRYAEAKQALDEADEIESGASTWKGGPRRMYSAFRSRMPDMPKMPKRSHTEKVVTESVTAVSPTDPDAIAESQKVVALYSKIAAVAGILPGGLLNFAAILAVQVVMVWRISKCFGHTDGKERIRGAVLSLFGSVLPTGIGHGAGVAIAALPAVITGTLVYFLVTPILAYALTKAVGNVFIMHFESGGTLLTFDPKKFGEYFLAEFKKAGGTVRHSAPESIIIQTA